MGSISPVLECGVATQLTWDNRTLAKAEALEGIHLLGLTLSPLLEALAPCEDALVSLLEAKTPVGQPVNQQTYNIG